LSKTVSAFKGSAGHELFWGRVLGKIVEWESDVFKERETD